jgi:hypothetical protein
VLPCHTRRRLLLAAPLASPWLVWPVLAPRTAHAQGPGQRPIPEDAELGRLEIVVFPQALLDGRPVVLGPGTRIFDEQNMIRPPSTVQGVQRVAFARGSMGEITRVWLVTDAEHREIAARITAARRAAQQR